MTNTEKLLCDLIALPSANPAFLPGGDPRTGEARVANFLAAAAAKAGLDVESQNVQTGTALPAEVHESAIRNPQSALSSVPSSVGHAKEEALAKEEIRSNLIVTLRPTGPCRQRLLLAPHLDTVPGTSDAQYVPRLKGARIYGRGACDTKGSVAAMFTALCQIAARGPRPAETEIVFAGLADEENVQSGSRALAASGFKADLAVVGEPTGLQIVTAHKGSLWLGLETRGLAAHGARPDLGRNAVLEMAQVVCFLETGYARSLRRKRHPVLGRATVSVGVITGGTQPNIVPDLCRASVDRRTLPGETEKSVRAELMALFQSRKWNVKIVDQKLAACLPMETDLRLPLVRQFFSLAGQKKAAGVDYFCDASVLAQAGIPSVVFGPGDIAQAHTADEWIGRKSLEAATALLEKFLRSLP